MPKSNQLSFVADIIDKALLLGLTEDRAYTEAAKAAQETGWGEHMQGNNAGNITAGSKWKGPTNTIIDNHNGKSYIMRAYPSLTEYLKDSVNLFPSIPLEKSGPELIDTWSKKGYSEDSNWNKNVKSLYRKIKRQYPKYAIYEDDTYNIIKPLNEVIVTK